jgi:hypothetical protein
LAYDAAFSQIRCAVETRRTFLAHRLEHYSAVRSLSRCNRQSEYVKSQVSLLLKAVKQKISMAIIVNIQWYKTTVGIDNHMRRRIDHCSFAGLGQAPQPDASSGSRGIGQEIPVKPGIKPGRYPIQTRTVLF